MAQIVSRPPNTASRLRGLSSLLLQHHINISMTPYLGPRGWYSISVKRTCSSISKGTTLRTSSLTSRVAETAATVNSRAAKNGEIATNLLPATSPSWNEPGTHVAADGGSAQVPALCESCYATHEAPRLGSLAPMPLDPSSLASRGRYSRPS